MTRTPDFTPSQMKAISHTKGNLQIIACAGSGKTETVSRRIATLIKEGENSAQIVAFTFNEKAAEELKARIRRILDQDCPTKADFGEMYIGTIHSFCLYMLKELSPKFKGYDVLDEAKRVAFVSIPTNYHGKLGLHSLEADCYNSKYRTIERFLESADIVRTEEVNPKKLTNQSFAKSFEAYENLLNEEHYMDFDGLISGLVKLVSANPGLKKLMHQKVQHLIVDEYQDVNRLQEKLISILQEGCKTLCVVGDDDQSIYHWRGSEIDNIRLFSRRYPKVTQIPLEENFRSTKAIIHSAASIIKNNSNRIRKTMKSPAKERNLYEVGDLTVKHFETEEEELESIPVKIKELAGTDFLDKSGRPVSISYGDIAVLVRTNEDAAKLVPVFERHKIACIVGGGQSVFESEEVQLALESLKHLFPVDARHVNGAAMTEIVTAYEQVFSKKEFPKADTERFIKRLGELKNEADKVSSKNKDYLVGGIQPFYLGILDAFGAGDFYFGDVYNYNLAVLSEAISDYETVWRRLRASEIKYFYGFVQAFASGRYAETQHSDVSLIDAVKILTIHKAKGLEFSVVFMSGLVKKRDPNPSKYFVDDALFPIERYRGTEEDERRVWYTAMTRSMKYLFLSSSKKRMNRVKNYEPHPFIAEIDRTYFSESKPLKRPRSGHPSSIQAKHFLPTSFSEISSYERCGHEYRLRHVFGFNVGVPTAFGYGTQIHNILNIIHKRFKKKPPTEREITKIFEKHFFMRYALGKAFEGFKSAALRVVKNYVKLHGSEFRMVLQAEKNFELVIDDALITGQIDLLKKVDRAGNITGIEIVDFKTENTSNYNPNHDLQLRLYALACMESLGLDPKKATVHHLDKNTKEDIDISKKMLEETKTGIKLQVQGIMDHKFEPRPSPKLCKDCDYLRICPYKRT